MKIDVDCQSNFYHNGHSINVIFSLKIEPELFIPNNYRTLATHWLILFPSQSHDRIVLVSTVCKSESSGLKCGCTFLIMMLEKP